MGALDEGKDSKDGWIEDLGEDTAADAAQLARWEEEEVDGTDAFASTGWSQTRADQVDLGTLLPQAGDTHQEGRKGVRYAYNVRPSILPVRQVGPIDSLRGLVRSRRTAVARRKCCSNSLSRP